MSCWPFFVDFFIIIIYLQFLGSRGLMVRESDSEPKGCGFESWSGRYCWWGGVNVQSSLHPQYHDWGALKQDTVCVCVCVCVHFGWVKAEHKFRVWVTILGCITQSISKWKTPFLFSVLYTNLKMTWTNGASQLYDAFGKRCPGQYYIWYSAILVLFLYYYSI